MPRPSRSHPLTPLLSVVLLVVSLATACSVPQRSSIPIPSVVTLPPTDLPRGGPGSGPLGLKWSRSQPATFDFVRRHPGGWTFAEVEWCSVEPTPGARDWTELDGVVEEALALGHQPLLKLRTGQCWGTAPPDAAASDTTEATRKTPSSPPVDVAAYLDLVTDLVQRYAAQGVHDYAVENEVDVTNFWAADMAAYDQLVREVAPTIRAADPDAHVLDAGVSSTSYGVVIAAAELASGATQDALDTYRTHYERRLAGGASRWPEAADVDQLQSVLATAPALRSIEAVAVAGELVRDGVVDAYQLHFYEQEAALEQVLDFIDDLLDGAGTVEAWEVGTAWPGDGFDARIQAEETYRAVARLLLHGIRRLVYLPAAYTPGTDIQVFRGLVEAQGAVLPAGRGWIALADALAGLGDAPVTAVAGGLTGAAWTTPAGPAAVVWSDGAPVALPTAGVEHVFDPTGEELDPDQPVGAEPVLVVGSVVDQLAGACTDPGTG